MRTILVIGIGAGDLHQLTLGAVDAIGRVEVFFVLDKGRAPELTAIRDEVMRRHASGHHRVVTIADPTRDPDPADYDAAVQDWHAARAERLGRAIDTELSPDGVGGMLVWGDPALYDSTLRILDRVEAAGVATFARTTIPGVSSVSALAAAHGIALHDIGEPVVITTGRRLAATIGATTPNVVVMLDGQLAFTELDPTGIEIFWGAYLGTPEELLIAGDLARVAERIVTARRDARVRLGWIMDIYLLRSRPT